ncbi:MAG: PKD domain-containing protein [Flavobacteriales bacterium]
MRLFKIISVLLIVFSITVNASAQCNTNTSICSQGTAGPFGFVPPGPPVGTCLDWIGPNIGYIILYVTQSGPLNLLIDGNSAFGCLDVAIFNIPQGVNPCTATQNNANQIGCNYASNCDGCNQFGFTFPGCLSSVPAPNVTAGQVLMIVVENWSASSTSFTLQLGPPPGAQTGVPNPTINPVNNPCVFDPAFQLTSTNPGGTWAGPGTSPAGMFNPATAGVGTHNITYTLGTAPCQGTAQIQITVEPPPGNAGTSVTHQICTNGAPVDMFSLLSGTPDPGGSWTNPSNQAVANIYNPANMPSGIYTYSIGQGNCVNTATVTIQLPAAIVYNLSADTIICQNGTASLSVNPTGGFGAPYQVNWNNGFVGAGPNNVNPTANSCYEVLVTDNLGCAYPSQQVCVDILPPLNLVTSGNASICPGDQTTISATGSGGSGGVYNYSWTAAGNFFTNGDSHNVSPTVTTEYCVTLTDNCESTPVTECLQVTFNPTPTVLFSSDRERGCYPVTINFTNDSDLALVGTANWTFSNGGTATGNNVSHTFSNPGCYNVTLTIQTPGGCVVSATQNNMICADDYPTAYFTTLNNPANIFNPTVQFIDQSVGANQWEWDFTPEGIPATSSSQNSTTTYPSTQPGTYPVTLTVTNSAGCSDEFTLNVIVNGIFTLYAPNAFTPNGDGINDLFEIKGEAINEANYNLKIFNRWGEMVFESNSLSKGWDGRTKLGENVPLGIYVWKITATDVFDKTDTPLEFTGHVSLIK